MLTTEQDGVKGRNLARDGRFALCVDEDRVRAVPRTCRDLRGPRRHAALGRPSRCALHGRRGVRRTQWRPWQPSCPPPHRQSHGLRRHRRLTCGLTGADRNNRFRPVRPVNPRGHCASHRSRPAGLLRRPHARHRRLPASRALRVQGPSGYPQRGEDRRHFAHGLIGNH